MAGIKNGNLINGVWNCWLHKHKLSAYRIALILGITPMTAKRYIRHPQFYFNITQINTLAGYTNTPILVIFGLIEGIGRTQIQLWYEDRLESAECVLNELWAIPAYDKDQKPPEESKRNMQPVNRYKFAPYRLPNHLGQVNTPPPDTV